MFRYVCLDVDDSPVTLELVKDHLKIRVSSDDTIIKLMADSATNFAERHTGRDIRAKTWYAFADAFPVACWELRRHPVDAVSEVRYPVAMVQTVVAASVYEIKLQSYYTLLITSDGEVWPSDSDIITDAVRISFSTKADKRSAEIVLGILRHISYLYENRGDDEQIINPSVFDIGRFYGDVRIPQI